MTATGSWSGPSYPYRGADIHCVPGGHVCGLVLNSHPLNGMTFGVPGTITPLVYIWLDEGRLPWQLRSLRTQQRAILAARLMPFLAS